MEGIYKKQIETLLFLHWKSFDLKYIIIYAYQSVQPQVHED